METTTTNEDSNENQRKENINVAHQGDNETENEEELVQRTQKIELETNRESSEIIASANDDTNIAVVEVECEEGVLPARVVGPYVGEGDDDSAVYVDLNDYGPDDDENTRTWFFYEPSKRDHDKFHDLMDHRDWDGIRHFLRNDLRISTYHIDWLDSDGED